MINELVNQDIRERAGSRPESTDVATRVADCSKLQPENSEFVSETTLGNRCVYTKDDNIIKIAVTKMGRKENSNARAVLENVEKNTDVFAMPKEISENNNILIQEKVDTDVSKFKDESQPMHDQTPLKKRMEKKMDTVEKQDGVRCSDLYSDNLGVKNDELVLVDLGYCGKQQGLV